MIAGIRRGGIFDNVTLVLTLVVIGMPIVVLAPLAQLLFGVKLGWFPPTAGAGRRRSTRCCCPALVLGALVAGHRRCG